MKAFSIGVNGSMLDDKPSGVGVYSINVINHLATLYSKDLGSPLTVFTPTTYSLSKNLRIIKLSRFLKSSKYGKLAAVCRFAWNTFYYPFQSRKMDIVLSPTTHGSLLSKNQVLTIHDLLSLRYKNISLHQRIYFKHFLPFLVARSKVVITVSETSKKDIIQFLSCPEEKVKVVYNGYDDHIYFPVATTEKLIRNKYGQQDYFLAIGPTYAHKNFESLLRAYLALPSATRQRHALVIAGGKPNYLAKLRKLVKELALEDAVHFIGYVPIELMPALYREAKAFIFPSLYEGFGIPLLEAMGSGCPVLASNTSSIPEVCGDAAYYFDPLQQHEITKAMQLIVSDSQLYLALRSKGLQRAGLFSWKKTASQVKLVLDKNLTTIQTN